MSTRSVAFDLVRVRPAPIVADQPRVIITRWRIYQCCDGERYLAGIIAQTDRLRVTTAVTQVIAAYRIVVTASGRLYELNGPPADCDAIQMVAMTHLAGSGRMILHDSSGSVWHSIEQLSR